MVRRTAAQVRKRGCMAVKQTVRSSRCSGSRGRDWSLGRVIRALALVLAGAMPLIALAWDATGPAAARPGRRLPAASGGRGPVFPGTHCPALPADNVWNTPITGLPVDSHSAAWLIHMAAGSTDLHPDYGPGGGKSTPYGIPWQITPSGQPLVKVRFDYADESDP